MDKIEKATVTKDGSRRRCFPVGLRPPFKHLLRERTNTNIINQYVNEQIYFKNNFMPYGTKLGAELVVFLNTKYCSKSGEILVLPLRGSFYLVAHYYPGRDRG
jgi:hypothetical protein